MVSIVFNTLFIPHILKGEGKIVYGDSRQCEAGRVGQIEDPRGARRKLRLPELTYLTRNGKYAIT